MGKPIKKTSSARAKRAMMIAPGLLYSYHQAKRLFNKNGVRPRVSQAASTTIAAASNAPSEPANSNMTMKIPTCTPMSTVVGPAGGVHYKMCRASLNQAAPLLQLPDDVLLKVLCTLKHDELKPVMKCCRRLRAAALAARNFHFNYTTPSQGGPGAMVHTQSTSGAAHRLLLRPRHGHGGPNKGNKLVNPPRATRAGSRLSKATRSSTSRTLHFATPRMLLGHA